MSLKDHLPKGVVDALFEAEESPASKATPPAAWVAPLQRMPKIVVRPVGVQLNPGIGYDAPPPSVMSTAVSDILSDLRGKTDFDATPAGQQLKACVDALADTGLSEEQKSKTAMKLSKLSPTQVVSILQGLQAVLTTEKQQFEATMQTATTAEVNARQAKSAQLQSSIDAAESQLNAMRQDKKQIDAELQQKQDKISSARANFSAAIEARKIELAEMISHYQSIPEVK